MIWRCTIGWRAIQVTLLSIDKINVITKQKGQIYLFHDVILQIFVSTFQHVLFSYIEWLCEICFRTWPASLQNRSALQLCNEMHSLSVNCLERRKNCTRPYTYYWHFLVWNRAHNSSQEALVSGMSNQTTWQRVRNGTKLYILSRIGTPFHSKIDKLIRQDEIIEFQNIYSNYKDFKVKFHVSREKSF